MDLENRQNVNTGAPCMDENPIEAHVAHTIRFIEENYRDGIDRDRAAREREVSPDYLGKQFKRFTGCTIREYINRVRIRAVKEDLVTSDRGVEVLAREAGFKSRRSFYRLFRDHMGMTPESYRKMYK